MSEQESAASAIDRLERVAMVTGQLEAAIMQGLADAHVHAQSGRYDQVTYMCTELGALAKVAHQLRHVLRDRE
jgi:hypothetical protein